MIVRYFASEWCMTSLFQKGKIYERWSFSFSSAVGSCTTNPPSSPFGFDNVGWKILPGGCRFSGGEMTGKFRKVASHYAPEPAFGLFLNLPEGSAPWNPGLSLLDFHSLLTATAFWRHIGRRFIRECNALLYRCRTAS